MRQTLCDGYLIIFALAQAVTLLVLTRFLRGFPGRITRAMQLPSRTGDLAGLSRYPQTV
mgnify:CR=1 FL=1